MATIGLSLESGSVYAVLFDPKTDAIVANRETPLDGGIAKALPEALDGMRAAAQRRRIDVDAVGIVFSSDAERDRLKTVVNDCDLGDVSMVSASSAFLGWLARSKEFADAQRVLLYYMGDAGVTISLADAAKARLSPVKKASLDSVGPERIGSTVPLAWEVLDDAGVKADVVALFGDRSGNRDLVDILALGLGIPVVRVADADQVAARGAALLAVGTVPEAVESVAAAEPLEPVPALASPPVAIAGPVRRRVPRKKIVLSAALLAAVLSGGVALASTLPGDETTTATPAETESTDPTGIDTNLAGSTSSVTTAVPPTTEAALPAPPAEAPVVAPPEAYTPVPVTWESAWTPAPVAPQGPVETLTPIPAQSIPANAAVVPHSTVEAPQFTVPPVIPEAGKSQVQLEQEAWDRHWQHTAEWLEQEIVGN